MSKYPKSVEIVITFLTIIIGMLAVSVMCGGVYLVLVEVAKSVK
jgi:hypothetical protein